MARYLVGVVGEFEEDTGTAYTVEALSRRDAERIVEEDRGGVAFVVGDAGEVARLLAVLLDERARMDYAGPETGRAGRRG